MRARGATISPGVTAPTSSAVIAESNLIGFDHIRDFSRGKSDKIDLSLIGANTVLGDNNPFTFSASFTGQTGHLNRIQDTAGLFARRDVSGDARADRRFEVRLANPGMIACGATDFLL